MSWFFEGRENELAQISAWLHNASSGLLVVTGRAGSGKSALLGTLLVRSLPDLARCSRPPGPGRRPWAWLGEPPASVFDAVIHLSGLDLAQAVTQDRRRGWAPAAALTPRPVRPAWPSTWTSWPRSSADRAEPFTVLADALDESLRPAGYRSLAAGPDRGLAGRPVLVGTRASTSEAPDAPAADQNLLDALGSIPGQRVIWISRDQMAVQRYVTGRLRAARDYGVAGRAVPHLSEISDPDIDRVAGEVAAGGQEFLFARLAVYELIADPRLLTRRADASREPATARHAPAAVRPGAASSCQPR